MWIKSKKGRKKFEEKRRKKNNQQFQLRQLVQNGQLHRSSTCTPSHHSHIVL